jgi:hypothetical protein
MRLFPIPAESKESRQYRHNLVSDMDKPSWQWRRRRPRVKVTRTMPQITQISPILLPVLLPVLLRLPIFPPGIPRWEWIGSASALADTESCQIQLV